MKAQAQIQGLILELANAVNARSIYPAGHPAVERSVQALRQALDKALAERETTQINLLVVGHDLAVDGEPLRRSNLYQVNLVRALTRAGVERLTFLAAVVESEIRGLLAGLVDQGPLETSAAVILGVVELRFGAGGEGGIGSTGWDGPRLSEVALDDVAAAFSSFGAEREASVRRMEERLWQFMEALARAGDQILLLAPVRQFDEHLFVHSINVSLLSMAQASSLGIHGQVLHDIGVAALLHDVGKLSLPPFLFDQEGALGEAEWEIVRRHPELGAAQLASVEGMTALAPLVAWEHHLRWDGKPSFPETDRKPSLASQLTAVADTWDTALSAHPEATARKDAARVLRSRAGTHLDPFLVANFLRLLTEGEESREE